MTLLMDWFVANKLTLNLAKTLAMEFWPVNDNNTSTIKIMDVEIPVLQVTKFLGVYLDDKLKWEYHANQVYNKIQANKQLLNISKNFLDVCSFSLFPVSIREYSGLSGRSKTGSRSELIDKHSVKVINPFYF